MKGQIPSPDFDHNKYERPNQDWICGWTCEGKPCRIGPSAKGECRAKFECRPILDKKPWEKKGRYRCTLPKEYGGPCENGPLPNGLCCRPVPPCVPTRSLRSKRGLFCFATVAALVGFLLVMCYGSWGWKFISPGEVSSHHRDAAFTSLRQSGATDDGCAACHFSALSGPETWVAAAFNANPSPLQFHHIAHRHAGELTQIDHSCMKCHDSHNFHRPNTTRDHSCSACHREHQGAERMKPPASSECASCHNHAEVMQASLKKALTLPSEAFDREYAEGMNIFQAPRPKDGKARVFATFAGEHPEFQIVRDQLKESNTLKFNHQKHLTGAIPSINGRQLACADCHQPDSAGKYFQRISFDTHCRTCHSLQFDAENPDLALPHGDTASVRSFLRSLSAQYAELARNRGMTRDDEVDKFVQTQIGRLRRLATTGENLEKQVFYTSDPAKPLPTAVSPNQSPRRAQFAGCAYCHEVRTAKDDSPIVTRPRMADRWMPGAEFNHSKHTKISCNNCHQVEQSVDTADILVPSKSNCTSCHSPHGGVSESCAMCHTFHMSPKKVFTSTPASPPQRPAISLAR